MQKHQPIEKIVFGFGLIILLAIFGYLIYQATWKESGPPQLSVTSSPALNMTENAYEVHIVNTGRQTAVNAGVKVSLYQNGKSVESTTLSFDYIPTKSEVKGWAVFSAKRTPTDSLVVSSKGYIKE